MYKQEDKYVVIDLNKENNKQDTNKDNEKGDKKDDKKGSKKDNKSDNKKKNKDKNKEKVKKPGKGNENKTGNKPAKKKIWVPAVYKTVKHPAVTKQEITVYWVCQCGQVFYSDEDWQAHRPKP